MKKISAVVLLAASLLVLGLNIPSQGVPFMYLPAEAHDDGKPMTKKMQKMKCDEMKKMRPMHEMLLETHAIMLETIRLVEKSSKDEETTKSAQALANRMEDLIQKHKELAESMMKKMCGGKMSKSQMEMEKKELNPQGKMD